MNNVYFFQISKDWIFENINFVEEIAKLFNKSVELEPAEKKLHLVYLINDVLHHRFEFTKILILISFFFFFE